MSNDSVPTGPRDGSAGERCDPGGHTQGAPLRSSGIGYEEVGVETAGPSRDPAKLEAGMVHQAPTGTRETPCPTTRRREWRRGVERRLRRGTMRPRRAPRTTPLLPGHPALEVSKKKGGLSCPPVPGAGAAVSRREWPRAGMDLQGPQPVLRRLVVAPARPDLGPVRRIRPIPHFSPGRYAYHEK